MVGDLIESLVHIYAPNAVEHLASNVIAEPVAAGEPDGFSVHIHDLGIFVDMEPVIVILIRSSAYRGSCHRSSSARSQQSSGSKSCTCLFQKTYHKNSLSFRNSAYELFTFSENIIHH